MQTQVRGISKSHLEHLRSSSGLSNQIIREAGIYTLRPGDIRKKLGFEKGVDSVLAFPYPLSKGHERYKLFPPVNGKKYHQKKGSKNHLYLLESDVPFLADISVPAWITEGEKKKLKGQQEGLFVIGLPGMWGFSDGKKGLLKNFDDIVLQGRIVNILPDNDYLTPNKYGKEKNLEQSVEELAWNLKERGAEVFIVKLPNGRENKGLDDFLLYHSTKELNELPKEKFEGRKEKKGKKKPSQAEIVIAEITKNIKNEEIKLFHNEDKEPFVFLDGEAISVRSRKMRQFLSLVYYRMTGRGLNSDSLNQILNLLEAVSIFKCPLHPLYNRVARTGDVFWYDLCSNGKVVRIDSSGWIIADAPILFRRYSHQMPQVIPHRGGDPWQIFKYLNIMEEHRLLILIAIISYFTPEIPHPMFHPHGPQGSAKTTACKVIKKVVDPSLVEVFGAPKDYFQVVQNITHHYLSIFDNVTELKDWISDLISQAISGGGFSKRQLFTDDDDIIYRIQRCVGLNGINLLVSKPDLMDRTVLMPPHRIEPRRRKEESKLWSEFEADRPGILGGIFNTLSRGMMIHPRVTLSSLHRMADFDRWGFAIGEALGEGLGKEFLAAYQKNVERQSEEVIQGNTLAQALLRLMEKHSTDRWEGTVGELFRALQDVIAPHRDDDTFPKVERTLRKHIERIAPTLLDHGLKFIFHPRTKDGFRIDIQKIDSQEDINFRSFDTFASSVNDPEDLRDEQKMNEKFSFTHDSPPDSTPEMNQNSHYTKGVLLKTTQTLSSWRKRRNDSPCDY